MAGVKRDRATSFKKTYLGKKNKICKIYFEEYLMYTHITLSLTLVTDVLTYGLVFVAVALKFELLYYLHGDFIFELCQLIC